MGQEGAKKCPLSWSPAQNPKSGRRGNVVISIFKRQRFRSLDREHSRIGFAGNDRHGAFMMVSRPRRADRACTLCPCPERPCYRRAAEQRDELAPFQLAARNLLLDRAAPNICSSLPTTEALGGQSGLELKAERPICLTGSLAVRCWGKSRPEGAIFGPGQVKVCIKSRKPFWRSNRAPASPTRERAL